MLGTSAALPDADHNNTYLLLRGDDDQILIDCAGCPLQTLHRAGADLDQLDSLIVTHRHPDHIYGVPALALGLWLKGRTRPLYVFGEQEGLAAISALLEIFRSEEWPLFFPLFYYEVPLQPHALILETGEFRVISSPAKHLVPTLALRIENKRSGRVVVYSSDTEPCDNVIALARGAHILIHEATGNGQGHSSSAQAAMIARVSGAQELILTHLPTSSVSLEAWRQEAAQTFQGPVHLAYDLAEYEF